MGQKIYTTILSVVMTVGAVFGIVTGQGSAEVVETETVSAVELAPATDWTEDYVPSYLTGAHAEKWVTDTLKHYGLKLPEGVTVWLTDNENCGSELGGYGTGGGCYTPATKMIRVSPTVAGTEAGTIILLHEYAHSLGYMDECAAESYSHSLFETNLWGYPECVDGFYARKAAMGH